MSRQAKVDHQAFISRCTQCGATYYEGPSGQLELKNGCDEPCSFVMRKAGYGDPPFLSADSIVKEIEKLMLRRSRSR